MELAPAFFFFFLHSILKLFPHRGNEAWSDVNKFASHFAGGWGFDLGVLFCFSWQNSVNLCPASFSTPGTNLPVTPGISWLPNFSFQSPMMKRASFLGVSSRRSRRSSHNLSISASSALLEGTLTSITMILNGLPWNEQRKFCHFWDSTQVLHFRLFCWLWVLHHFF